MIRHKLLNKTKSATIAEPKKISPIKQALHHDAWGMETIESPLSTLALEEPTKVHI
jgi:hypothetical protein